MRTFEEYIVEAKQSYIFGGTDDRNTNVESKTFGELVKGDTFYWLYSTIGIPYKRTVRKVETNKRDNAIRIYYKYGKLPFTVRIVGLKNLNETSYDYESTNTVGKPIFYCAATSEEEFLKIVNAYGYNFTSKDIIDQTE